MVEHLSRPGSICKERKEQISLSDLAYMLLQSQSNVADSQLSSEMAEQAVQFQGQLGMGNKFWPASDAHVTNIGKSHPRSTDLCMVHGLPATISIVGGTGKFHPRFNWI